MKQGCILVDPSLIAQPAIFDALTDNFNIIRHLEVDRITHVLICTHEQFIEAAEGDILPFYEVEFTLLGGAYEILKISKPYVHSKIFLRCQNQKEEPRNQDESESLIRPWM
jgi:hypothetical protein